MRERIESAEEFVEEFMLYRLLHPQKVYGRPETPVKPKRTGSRRKCAASPEELSRMYLKEGKTAGEIAEKYGMATVSVRKLLKKYGIRREK